MKVEIISKEFTDDKFEYRITGICPSCGRLLYKDAKGEDEECCGEFLEWEEDDEDEDAEFWEQDEDYRAYREQWEQDRKYNMYG